MCLEVNNHSIDYLRHVANALADQLLRLTYQKKQLGHCGLVGLATISCKFFKMRTSTQTVFLPIKYRTSNNGFLIGAVGAVTILNIFLFRRSEN